LISVLCEALRELTDLKLGFLQLLSGGNECRSEAFVV
jgi:hypothetical protein